MTQARIDCGFVEQGTRPTLRTAIWCWVRLHQQVDSCSLGPMKAIPTVTEAMHCPVYTQIATTLATVVGHLGSPASMAMAVATETAEGTGTVAETETVEEAAAATAEAKATDEQQSADLES